MTEVLKESCVENIFKNFYDSIVAITGFTTICYPSFPDITLDAKGDYPIVIIGSPEIGWDTFTFGLNLLEGTITIDIYTTEAKTTDQYASDVQNKIETDKDTLAGYHLRQIRLESTSTDMAPQGKIKVHLKTLTFAFKFYFQSTRAY